MERTALIVNCELLKCATSSPAQQSVKFFLSTGWVLAEEQYFNLLGLDFYQKLTYFKRVKQRDQCSKNKFDVPEETDRTLNTIVE